MAEYNRIQINTTHFTSDGTDTGLPCRLDVEGLLALRLTQGRITRNAIDGTPRRQVRSRLGKQIVAVIESISKENTLDAFIDELNTVEAGGDAHHGIFVGDTGYFDLDLELAEFGSSGAFLNGSVKAVRMVFAVKVINTIAAEEPEP